MEFFLRDKSWGEALMRAAGFPAALKLACDLARELGREINVYTYAVEWAATAYPDRDPRITGDPRVLNS